MKNRKSRPFREKATFKPLSKFRGQFGGQGTMDQERNLYLCVRTGKDNTLQLVSALRMFAQKPYKNLKITKMT